MVLFHSPWPNPRAGGLCSAAYEIIKAIINHGWDALLVTPAGRTPLGPQSLQAALISGARSYDWRETVANLALFRNFRHLTWADRFGAFGGVPHQLAPLAVIHSQLDGHVSGESTTTGSPSPRG